ncbi:cytochrome b561 [Rhodovulum visakhapatnamense]|uniref:Cytochrome b561 n=2 Tax=Rhodovulum visakhapatnamense TaxID=364297 RepID=A0A4R8FWQ6_9RHOB|nr:cytochrome b561 [Rhodovulum visakhapatnamense]
MSVKGYSSMQIRLHWAVFGLVVVQFLFGNGMGHAFGQYMDTGEKGFSLLVGLHILIGLSILVLAFWRLGLRFLHGVPAPDPAHSPAQVLLARVIHGGLYVLMVALPVSGMLAWSLGSGLAAGLHAGFRVILVLLILLHVAAALMGQYIKKDGTLTRMLKAEG